MAFKLAEAYVQLSKRGFGTVTGAIGSVRKSLGGLVGFATGPVVAGMAAIGGTAAVGGMVKLAASAEQTRAQFATLLGSAEAAKQMVRELTQFSATTPFQMEGLKDTAKTLLSFGTAQEQVLPTMQVLGDIAAATGNNINEMANIYGKAQSRGALMTEQLDQFNERGIPVGAELAKMLGKTGAEIRAMASSGEIGFGMLQQAMVNMSSEGGVAFNGMSNQASTLTGLWSTFSDNVTILLTGIGEAIVEGFDIKSVVSMFTGFVSDFTTNWMPSIARAAAWASENIAKPVVGFVTPVFQKLQKVLLNFDLIYSEMTLFALQAFDNIWQSVSSFFNNSWTMAKWFGQNFTTIFTNIISNAGNLFQNYIKQVRNNWESLLNFFRTGRLEFDWSPMVDSFNLALGELKLPELETPELNRYQDQIREVQLKMIQRTIDHAQAAADAANASETEKGNRLAIQNSEQKITEEKEKQRGFEFVSISQLAEKMQQQIFDRSEEDSNGIPNAINNAPVAQLGQSNVAVDVGNSNSGLLSAMQQQINAIQSLVGLAEGSGLRVAAVEGPRPTSLPQESVRFGGAQ